MKMMKKGKGQIQSQVFVYIIALVILVLIIIFGYRSITRVGEQQKQITDIKFEKDLKDGIETIASDFGTVKKHVLSLPEGVNRACFIDLGQRELLLRSDFVLKYPFIKETVVDKTGENTFLFRGKNLIKSLFMGEICFDKGIVSRCIDAKMGKLNILMEGKGNCTNIAPDVDLIKLGNQKNKNKYKHHPVFFIARSEQERNILRTIPLTSWNDRKGGILKLPLYVYARPPAAEFGFDEDYVQKILDLHNSDEILVFTSQDTSPLGPLSDKISDEHVFKDKEVGAYMDYWSIRNDIVVIDGDNVEDGLIAGLFSAFIDAPLLFIDSGIDDAVYNANYKQFITESKKIYLIKDKGDDLPHIVGTRSADFPVEKQMPYSAEMLKTSTEINRYQKMWGYFIPGQEFKE